MQTIMAQNKKDLSHIDSMDELKAEIRNVSARIKLQERDLNERLAMLPHETIKATVSKVVPSFISSFLPGKSIGIITGVMGLLLGKGNFENGGWKNKAIDMARQVSLYAAAKTIFTLWRKRKRVSDKAPG